MGYCPLLQNMTQQMNMSHSWLVAGDGRHYIKKAARTLKILQEICAHLQLEYEQLCFLSYLHKGIE